MKIKTAKRERELEVFTIFKKTRVYKKILHCSIIKTINWNYIIQHNNITQNNTTRVLLIDSLNVENPIGILTNINF